jgi:hypothetical protein
MAGKVLNIKVCSPLKLRSGLTGNYHAICHYSYNLPLYARLKRHRYIDNWIDKLKILTDRKGAMIGGLCKKKLVFAHPLLPFGTVREAHAHCTHLQIAQAVAQTKICKRVQF